MGTSRESDLWFAINLKNFACKKSDQPGLVPNFDLC